MKVQLYKITRPLHENLVVKVDEDDTIYDKLHQHDEIQISYVSQGRGKLIISGNVYPYATGDIFVIGEHIPHLFQSKENDSASSLMISVFFTKETFGNQFFDLPELEQLRCFFDKSKKCFKLSDKVDRVRNMMKKLLKADKFERFILFLKIIKILCKAKTKVLKNVVYNENDSKAVKGRLQAVFDFALNNFQKTITLTEVSEIACLTPNAFCRFFKQRTGKTFFQFIIELRIEHASQLLMNPNMTSVKDVACNSGFSSIANFNRKFKELRGDTPYSYHKKFGYV